MKKLLLIFIFLSFNLFAESLKPQSQLAFEKELQSVKNEVDKKCFPDKYGTRACEKAKEAEENFWKDKRDNMTRVDNWVCKYTNTYKWVPRKERSGDTPYNQPEDVYRLLGAYCNDAYSPAGIASFTHKFKMEMEVEIPFNKVTNVEPLYQGDVIAVSGRIDLTHSIQKHFSGYRIKIIADSFKVIKKEGSLTDANTKDNTGKKKESLTDSDAEDKTNNKIKKLLEIARGEKKQNEIDQLEAEKLKQEAERKKHLQEVELRERKQRENDLKEAERIRQEAERKKQEAEYQKQQAKLRELQTDLAKFEKNEKALEDQYIGYKTDVSKLIYKHIKYPRVMQLRGRQKSLEAHLIIDNNGSYEVLFPSGDTGPFEKAVVNAVYASEPLPKPPGLDSNVKLKLIIPFNFSLN